MATRLPAIDSRADFDEAVTADCLTVALFTAGWSKPCKGLGIQIEKLAASLPAASFITVDLGTDEGEELALELGVLEPPTIRIHRAGVLLGELAGTAAADPEAVAQAIGQFGSLTPDELAAAAAEAQRAYVRERYAASATQRSTGCCDGAGAEAGAEGEVAGGAGCCDVMEGALPPRNFEKMGQVMGYSEAEAASLGNLGLGCGNPLADINLQPGETVLDLGSGAGFDCLLASSKVGPTGSSIGVDMTADMLSTARKNAAAAVKTGSIPNVSFRLGEIEHLPVADGVVDAIISNCVVNLSFDQPQGMLAAAGFESVSVRVKDESKELIAGWMPGSGAEDYVRSAVIQASKPVADGV